MARTLLKVVTLFDQLRHRVARALRRGAGAGAGTGVGESLGHQLLQAQRLAAGQHRAVRAQGVFDLAELLRLEHTKVVESAALAGSAHGAVGVVADRALGTMGVASLGRS